jgi:beta-galactosidase GanA
MQRLLVFPLTVFSAILFGFTNQVMAEELPHLDRAPKSAQLIVNGKPFLVLGGELSNSAAGTAGQADQILPRVARSHVNTVLMPVAWEQIEPTEGKFDFSILDHWIERARTEKLHLVLLWFGSWKNGVSSYAPEWVKKDPKRFPRVISPFGQPLEILSTLSRNNLESDTRAFRGLMRHVKEVDANDQTVLMIQIENEVGVGGSGRDRSPEADRLYDSPVPQELVHDLKAHRERFSPELARIWSEYGHTWREMFGDGASEVFMAWNYARYLGKMAEDGKKEYSLPMFVNAQLPAPFERAGEYPSGGPHPYYLEVYRAAAPALDFFSPDIYWPDFEYWCQRYSENGNPLFIPEARLEQGSFNALYAYGEARAFGFSPFSIDSLPDVTDEGTTTKNPVAESYAMLDQVRDILPQAQREGRTRGLLLHASGPRATQTVSLDGYLFQATLARSWPAKSLLQDDGAMILINISAGEFLIGGTGLSVTVSKDLDVGGGTSGLTSVEEVSRVGGKWVTLRRLNGDENNQGRSISLPAHQFRLLRVRLYTIPTQ